MCLGDCRRISHCTFLYYIILMTSRKNPIQKFSNINVNKFHSVYQQKNIDSSSKSSVSFPYPILFNLSSSWRTTNLLCIIPSCDIALLGPPKLEVRSWGAFPHQRPQGAEVEITSSPHWGSWIHPHTRRRGRQISHGTLALIPCRPVRTIPWEFDCFQSSRKGVSSRSAKKKMAFMMLR